MNNNIVSAGCLKIRVLKQYDEVTKYFRKVKSFFSVILISISIYAFCFSDIYAQQSDKNTQKDAPAAKNNLQAQIELDNLEKLFNENGYSVEKRKKYYEAFILDYAGTKAVDEAKKILEELNTEEGAAYIETLNNKTLDAYNAFLEKYPSSKYSAKIREEYEKLNQIKNEEIQQQKEKEEAEKQKQAEKDLLQGTWSHFLSLNLNISGATVTVSGSLPAWNQYGWKNNWSGSGKVENGVVTAEAVYHQWYGRKSFKNYFNIELKLSPEDKKLKGTMNCYKTEGNTDNGKYGFGDLHGDAVFSK